VTPFLRHLSPSPNALIRSKNVHAVDELAAMHVSKKLVLCPA
jgi:hypothetical protein